MNDDKNKIPENPGESAKKPDFPFTDEDLVYIDLMMNMTVDLENQMKKSGEK